MSNLIEMGKQYRTRGNPIRILCTDAYGDRPVIALAPDGVVIRYTADGQGGFDSWGFALPPFWDLIEVKPPITVWVNAHRGHGDRVRLSGAFQTKDAADQDPGYARIACFPVTFTEGDGL